MANPVVAWTQQKNSVSIVGAHRGLSGLGPESTEAAYKAAGKIGEHLPNLFLEADIQRTRDGQLVIVHDGNARRTTDIEQRFPRLADKEIGELTLDELQALDAGSWFNQAEPNAARESFVGQRILTFDAFLTLAEANGNGRIYLETKTPDQYPGIEKQILEQLRARGWIDANNRPCEGKEIIWQSFNAGSLQIARELAPEIPRTLLLTKQKWGNALKTAQDVGASTIAPHVATVFPWRITSAHQAGMKIQPYTVNSRKQLQLLAWMGVDGYFTDRSDIALELATGVKLSPDVLFSQP